MRRILILSLLFFLPVAAYSQLYAMRDSVKNGYDFWLYLPEQQADSVSAAMPVVLFLHGQSLCGSDLYRVRRYGCLDAVSRGRQIDAAIIAPQNRGGSWNPKRLLRVLEWVESRYAIDTNRVYVFGMSLGGYGAIDFAGTYPEKTAAAIAMCGGSTLRDFSTLSRVPLWILHGTADRAVPISESRKVVDAVNACDTANLLRFTPLPGANHGHLARVFYREEPYQWLFSHSLSDSIRTVNRDFSLDMASLNSVYQHLSPKSQKLKVVDERRPTGSASAVASGDNTYYSVRKGDTLGAIAGRYHTSVAALCRLNGISKTSILRIGQRLRIG